MRIHFLLTQDLHSPSGLGRYYPLARELSRLGHQVTISGLHSNYAGLQDTRIREGALDIRYVAPMHVQKIANEKKYYSTGGLLKISARAAWALTRSALQTPADIVHIGKPHPMNSLAGLVARLARRSILALDCDDYEAGSGHFTSAWQKAVITFFERRMPRQVSLVTTHTRFMQDNLLAWGVPPDRILYLPNGIDGERFRPPDPQVVAGLIRQYRLEGKQVVAFIGSLSRPSHPLQLLMEAFALCAAQNRECVLLVVGGGEDFPRLREASAAAGLADSIVFTGRVPPEEIPAYYALAHVSIDPVHDDPAARGRSPLKLFESWACGVPFVSADVGERRALLGDPPAGVLVEPGSPTALADAILQLLADPVRCAGLIDLGRERVQDYQWAGLAKTMQAAYRNLIAARGSRA